MKPTSTPTPPNIAPPSAPQPPLCYGKAVSKEFRKRVYEIAATLQCDPSHLMAVMALETRGRFAPDLRNNDNGDVGLVQFQPHAAIEMRTTQGALMHMTAVQQLDYVEHLLHPFSGRLESAVDVYMAVLWPAAIGKPGDFELFSEGDGTRIYFEGRKIQPVDGKITKQQCAARVEEWLARGLQEENAYDTE